MPEAVLPDVFTAEEVARAAGVPLHVTQALVDAGELPLIPGTRFVAATDAISVGRRLSTTAALMSAAVPPFPPPLFSGPAETTALANRGGGIPAAASFLVHTTLLVAVLWLTSYATETAPASTPREDARMVFLTTPGPGGGGGGGGMRNPLPARRIERAGRARPRIPVPAVKPDRTPAARRAEAPRPTPPQPIVPKPIERAPEPPSSTALLAPVVAAATSERDKEGVIQEGRPAESQGSGAGGGSGSGQGTGNGEGLGPGIGNGSGGGTGGGPFRPGSGIEPPRLLREIKADYSEDARRRGLTGDVVLEIVVRHDGTVGEVTVLQGLDAGLDQRAVAAVRQWRFTPARRKGEAVDVIVEVAVEFTLR
jgi:periplasmic protein TonB